LTPGQVGIDIVVSAGCQPRGEGPHVPALRNACRTLEEALAWCLVRLMALEIGVGPFLV
jgi:hypothetical protein